MSGRTVVVLGAGIGGIVAARRLRRRVDPGDRVVLVDRTATYTFTPSLLWVMAGLRRPSQIVRDLSRLRRRGIELFESRVEGLDLDDRRVVTSAGPLRYDRLVVALGAELAPEAMPGFSEAAHDVYTLEGAVSAGRALRSLQEGRVVMMVSSQPYKCPAAPYETALLTEALLRRRGVRDAVTIDIYTPDPFPMATAGRELGDALSEMLADRGIRAHFGQDVERVDAEAGELVLAGGETVGFDLLLGVPPHRAPEPVRADGLAGPSGFVPVDPATLETGIEGVHALGDATVIPIAGGKALPKAGVFAEAQARVVADRIAAELAGRAPTSTFDGKGSCFVEMGDGRAAFASGDFYAPGAPDVRLRRPGRRWHAAKVALERYWLRTWPG